MLKRRIGIAVALICLIGLYAFRVYAVNTDIKLPIRQVYKKSEAVPYEKDFNTGTGSSDGYTVQVLDSKIMSAKDFCEKYNVTDMKLATHYYMVKVSVENISNHHVGEEGVPLGISMLIGTNYCLIPSPDMFSAVNTDMPSQAFSLRLGTQKEVWLVFQIIPGVAPERKQIEEDPPMLQITQYPHQKLIQLT
ncbi:MAG: DUF5028 domain-containing protein [Lachnospiraceae bacterium]|nr:DUF5028 domain-containing protein [Lachnospiraceae bacterium]